MWKWFRKYWMPLEVPYSNELRFLLILSFDFDEIRVILNLTLTISNRFLENLLLTACHTCGVRKKILNSTQHPTDLLTHFLASHFLCFGLISLLKHSDIYNLSKYLIFDTRFLWNLIPSNVPLRLLGSAWKKPENFPKK